MTRYNHDHDVPFEAFITNLSKYNEGDLVGEWVKFPTTSECLRDVFRRIGICSTDRFSHSYEEWFITDYDVYVDGIRNILGEHENLDELNFLASRIEELSDYEYVQFEAIIEEGIHTSSVADLINVTFNLDTLDVAHVQVLLSKKLISEKDAEELNGLIDKYGVDPVFLKSLNTSAEDDTNFS